MQESQLVSADDTIQNLQSNQTKLQFQADSLTLARDATQIAALLGEEVQSERAKRLAKVLHLKQENHMGGAIVAKHVAQHCRHSSGPVALMQFFIEKAWVRVGISDKWI